MSSNENNHSIIADDVMQNIILRITSHIPYTIQEDENNTEDTRSCCIRFTDDEDTLYRVSGNQLNEVLEAIEDAREETTHEEIPVNSMSFLVDEATSRFSSAIWYDKIQEKTIILAGLGGIGSWVGFLLSRMHPRSIFLYDFDMVERANMSGQLYCDTDMGKSKTNALVNMVRSYSNYNSCFATRGRYDEECEAANIMICGFDNMQARKLFFNKWVAHVNTIPEENKQDCLFIDGRLSAEEFQVLCIRGDDEFNIQRYCKEYLFSDEEAEETVCSYKQTSYMASMIASVIVNLFTNFVANQCNPLIDRYLPFYTGYSAELMQFTTEV